SSSLVRAAIAASISPSPYAGPQYAWSIRTSASARAPGSRSSTPRRWRRRRRRPRLGCRRRGRRTIEDQSVGDAVVAAAAGDAEARIARLLVQPRGEGEERLLEHGLHRRGEVLVPLFD